MSPHYKKPCVKHSSDSFDRLTQDYEIPRTDVGLLLRAASSLFPLLGGAPFLFPPLGGPLNFSLSLRRRAFVSLSCIEMLTRGNKLRVFVHTKHRPSFIRFTF
jgi:hypothetical protein